MRVGAVTKDVGLTLTRLSFQIAHATDVDTNAEREFLVAKLIEHGGIERVRYHLPGEHLSLGTVNRYVSDGLVALAELRPQSRSALASRADFLALRKQERVDEQPPLQALSGGVGAQLRGFREQHELR